MISKPIVAFLLLSVGLSGCNSGNNKADKTNTNTVEEAEKEAAVSVDAKEIPDDENVFRSYDAVKKILKKWNQAISEHQVSELENLYADEVSYYAKKSNKQAILTQKSDWLKKHASYKQELGYTDVYYEGDDPGVEFVAQFTKVCIENGKKTEIESYLYFRKFGKEWKIVRETDAITEVNAARMKPVIDLPEGSYKYYLGQWSDTRDIPQFAHDQVPYNATLDFTIQPGGITGIYAYYSGTARSQTRYLIKSGKGENGILELKMVYTAFDDPEPEDLDGNEETETWRFKTLENNRLICLSKENVSLYARTLAQSVN